MPDDRANRGEADRSRVAVGEGYELDYFAEKHGISRADARRLIQEHGNNRERLDEAAEKFKAASF